MILLFFTCCIEPQFSPGVMLYTAQWEIVSHLRRRNDIQIRLTSESIRIQFSLSVTYLSVTYLSVTYLSVTYLSVTYLSVTYLSVTYLSVTYLSVTYLSLNFIHLVVGRVWLYITVVLWAAILVLAEIVVSLWNSVSYTLSIDCIVCNILLLTDHLSCWDIYHYQHALFHRCILCVYNLLIQTYVTTNVL